MATPAAPASAPDSPTGSPSSPSPASGVVWAQLGITAAFYTIPAIHSLFMALYADPDFWWHLATGRWIVEHHWVPRTDPFSAAGAGRPWCAYSWLFELLVLGLFGRLGLGAMVAYTAAMALAFTVCLHRMIRRLQPDFTLGIALSFAAVYCLFPMEMPRSWWFSILFFVIELDILLAARRTGRMAGLAWLPPLFALWANLHIQFIDGLVVLAIALAEALAAPAWRAVSTPLRPRSAAAVLIACAVAVLANPYGWQIYPAAYRLAAQQWPVYHISEMQAMSFRSSGDFVALGLATGAVAVLARARRIALFETALLAFAMITGFRSQRDAWILTVVSAAVLASGLRGRRGGGAFRLGAPARFAAVAAAVLVSLAVFRLHGPEPARMEASLARCMPVRAARFAAERHLAGPLYNDFLWGGYLMWSLDLPVEIDGRTTVYPDERLERSTEAWAGRRGWDRDPDLMKAGLVIGPACSPLSELLRTSRRFRLVYEDTLATVFVAVRGPLQ